MKLPKKMKDGQKSIFSFNRVMNGLKAYNAIEWFRSDALPVEDNIRPHFGSVLYGL